MVVGAFNFVGLADLVLDNYHAIQIGLPALAGQLGSAYVILVIYVPALKVTHVAAFYLLVRPRPKTPHIIAGDVVAPK